MHELSLCMNLIDQLTELAAQHRATAVARIELQVGTLSGVEPLLLEDAFPIASTGSIAEKAVLAIEIIAPQIRCRRCHLEAQAEPNRLVCTSCGSLDTELLCGQDLILSRVELVRDTTAPPSDESTEEHHVH